MELPEKEQFNYKECIIAGDKCWLVNPNDLEIKWTEENLKFRSLIIRQDDNFVVSSGFKKFFNLNEKPDLDKFPEGPFEAIEKKDGFLLCISKYKGELIHRTRGTSNAEILETGHELEFLKKKYPKLFHMVMDGEETMTFSLLFEWETPNNVIILRDVDEPTLTLIGAIDHTTFEYLSQLDLDWLAGKLKVPRPQRYEYETLKECVEDVALWKGKEGVVLYSSNGQHLRKVKASEYLRLHALLSGYSTVHHILQVFLEAPNTFLYSEEFSSYIENNLDYEIANRNQQHIDTVCEAYRNYLCQIDKIQHVLEGIESFSKKEKAQDIEKHWKEYDWRRSVAFCIVNEKPVFKKLFRQALETEINKIYESRLKSSNNNS